jgi:PAS domain S-box-containing protein
VGDTKGRIISINPAWTEALGWSEDELLLKSGEWLVHPDDLEKSQKEQISLVEGRKTGHFENRIRDKLGKYHVVSWRAVPNEGRIYAVGRDVTELRDAEEQLRASRRELARVSQQTAVGVATASIAHEINQPLAAIVANANAGLRWLDRPVPNIAEVRAVLERIVRDGHHTNEVISGIRDMFGKGRLERAFLNLNTLIEEVLALMRRELESHQVLLRTQMADGLPDVLVERVQLQQVLVNLITNAVDAMSSEPGRTRQLTITSELHNAREVRISVQDSGSGIDPSHIDQIFQAFFTTKPHGMGMGLSICRSIVEAHGGSLWAVPRSPHGTTFYLQLPRTGDVRGPS